jgi:hypothetical protein
MDHAGFKAEVIVHIFGIRAEQAAEIYAASGHSIKRVPDKGGYIAAAEAKSSARGKIKTIET